MKKIERLTESDLKRIVSKVIKESEESDKHERVPKEKLTDIIDRLEKHLSQINLGELNSEWFYSENNEIFPFEWFIRRLKKFTLHLAEDIYEFINDNYDWMENLSKEQMVRDILINSLLWFFYVHTGKEYEGEDFYSRRAKHRGWYSLVLKLYGEVIGEFYDEVTEK